MSDEPETEADDGDIATPGGGPRRVVSSTSVDDILASIEDEPSTDDDSVRLEYDEAESDGADDGAADDAATDDESDDEAADESDDTESSVARDDAADVDEPSVEEESLAARIETGAVTGADVRAAEAGEGRESTPEIDEIDLSLDDLEEPAAGSDLEESPEPEPEDDEDGGLFGRVRGLFSR